MIIIMKPNATPKQVEDVIQVIQSLELTPHLYQGIESTVIGSVDAGEVFLTVTV